MATAKPELRVRALEIAAEHAGDPEQIVSRAATYLAFLEGTSSLTKTPTAEPEPPRLDDPVVVEQTETLLEAVEPEVDPTPAVTDRPTLKGTEEVVPSTAGGQAETPPVVQGEKPAPVAEVASADGAIDIAKVQAAVIAASKGIGRDQTVAILTAHGGARLPDVPAEKHADLFAALNAALVAAGKPPVAA